MEPSNQIYGRIKKKLKLTMSKKAIYSHAWQWNHKHQDHKKANKAKMSQLHNKSFQSSSSNRTNSSIESHSFVASPNAQSQQEDETLSDVSSELISQHNSFEQTGSSFDDTSKTKQKNVKFRITISAKKWKTISPIVKKNEKRNRLSLEPGVWTSVILNEICSQKRNLSCQFTFKRCNVYPSGKKYVILEGSCKICGASLSGNVKEKPEDNEKVIIKFIVSNIDDEKHKAKAQNAPKLYGAEAQSIYSTHANPMKIRRSMMQKHAEMFERPTKRIPTANAISSGKYRQRIADRLHKSPFKSLELLQQADEYKHTIKFLSANPFGVHYISNDQLALYDMYKKLNNGYTKISGDATGGTAKSFSKFLFTCFNNLKIYWSFIKNSFFLYLA